MKRQIYGTLIKNTISALVNLSKKVKEKRPEVEKINLNEEIKIEDEVQITKNKLSVNKNAEINHIWHDIRQEPRTKDRGKSKGIRDWKKITGITLHQTACQFGTNPMRLLNVPVHGATLIDGSIVLMHEPTAYMYHAGILNKTDIGIEVSCSAPGVMNEGSTFWLPKKYKHLKDDERLARASLPTDEQLEATKELVKYYVNLVKENGGKIKYIHAHRQSSKSRISDPGEQIWKAVGEWAVNELGLDPQYGWTKGGYPLPDVWTGKPNGVKYSWKFDGRIKK